MDEALAHAYLSEYSMPEDEPVAEASLLVDVDGDETITDINVWKGTVDQNASIGLCR